MLQNFNKKKTCATRVANKRASNVNVDSGVAEIDSLNELVGELGAVINGEQSADGDKDGSTRK